MRHERAFTLIEMISTVALVGVVVAVGIPSFTDMINNSRMTSQANAFHAALTYGRMEAVKRREDIQFKATNYDWADGFTITVATGPDAYTELRKIDPFPGEVTLVSADTKEFLFRSTGTSSVVTSFALCDSRTAETGRLIALSATGRPAVTDLVCP